MILHWVFQSEIFIFILKCKFSKTVEYVRIFMMEFENLSLSN